MLNKVAGSSGIRFRAEIDRLDGLFSTAEEINLYRIVQESVNNIVKHSKASEARVVIKTQDHRLDINIQDNSQGFSPKRNSLVQGKRGFGLIGIAERARLLGRRPIIEYSPGQGTTIQIKLVLPAAPNTLTQ